MVWDGKVERRGNPSDHDNIVRLMVSIENHVNNFDKHVVEDAKNFGSVNSKIDKQSILIYTGVGILIAVQFILKLK